MRGIYALTISLLIFQIFFYGRIIQSARAATNYMTVFKLGENRNIFIRTSPTTGGYYNIAYSRIEYYVPLLSGFVRDLSLFDGSVTP
jgi:hypothetical protein